MSQTQSHPSHVILPPHSETNLKVKQALTVTGQMGDTIQALAGFKGEKPEESQAANNNRFVFLLLWRLIYKISQKKVWKILIQKPQDSLLTVINDKEVQQIHLNLRRIYIHPFFGILAWKMTVGMFSENQCLLLLKCQKSVCFILFIFFNRLIVSVMLLSTTHTWHFKERNKNTVKTLGFFWCFLTFF